jgi:hypothetical protein
MRIEQSLVSLASRRVATVTDMTRSSTEAWIGDRPVRNGTAGAVAAATSDARAAATARLSAKALAVARDAANTRSLPASGSGPTAVGTSATLGLDATDPTVSDPKLAVLLMLIERLTGRKIHLIKPGDVPTNAEDTARRAGQAVAAASAAAQSAPAQPQRAGWGVDVKIEQVHQETETTGFSANGRVITSDGRTISFDYRIEMHRDLTQTSATELQAGDAVKKVDPLALNLAGGPVALSSSRSSFDINSDGAAEQVALPAAGTYFLALDANGNGSIDNGSELFGPVTGNGFTELKALDSDHNGWIDAGDTAYASLKLWSGVEGGLKTLDQAGVGALYVGKSVSTQFDLRNDANETMGQVISSSVYLGQNGTPGALQQVDLTA